MNYNQLENLEKFDVDRRSFSQKAAYILLSVVQFRSFKIETIAFGNNNDS